MEDTTAYLAFDIEKAGCLPIRHPVIAVGVCLGDEDGLIIEKKRWTFQVQWPDDLKNPSHYGDFEPRCWEEFWSKQKPELIAELKQDAKPQKEGWNDFVKWVDELEKKYSKIVLLSDNPGYDLGAIDVNLERYTERMPLRYASTTGDYRSLIVSDDAYYIASEDTMMAVKEERLFPFVQPDHRPENDAEVVFRQYLVAMELKHVYSMYEMLAEQDPEEPDAEMATPIDVEQ